MKKVLIPLAEGFEEIEAITLIDILRRAGLEVTTAGIGSRRVKGSHGIEVGADVLLDEAEGLPDAVVLPGGSPGSENLSRSRVLIELLHKMYEGKKLIGAICAAPAVVLGKHGFLKKKKATCFPGLEDELGPEAIFCPDRVVKDESILTSRAAGTAMEFALALVKELAGEIQAKKLGERVLAAR